jgi:O-antigen ligase
LAWLQVAAARGLLLVGALLLAVAAGALVAFGYPQLALGLAVALPVAALVLRNPFMAVILWALVMPFFLESTSAEASPALWALHRLSIPGTLALVAVYHGLGIRRSPFRIGLIDFAIAGFLVLGIANVLIYDVNTQRELVSFYDKLEVPVMLFWLVRAIGPSRDDIKLLIGVGLLTIAFQVTLGVMSWFTPSLLPPQWLGRAGERTVGTFGGPAPYTITLVFFALLAVQGAMRDRPGLRRLVVFSLVITALLAVFLSLSRGSWLGAVLAFGGLAILYPRVVASMAVIGLVVAGALAAGPLGEQIAYAQQRLDDEATVESRIITNDAATRMIEDRPFIGFGFGNFERYDEEYKQRVGDIPLKLGGSAHNTYLNLAAEMGLPAVALYFFTPLVLLLRTIRVRQRLKQGDGVAWALCVVLWLALLDQFAVSNFLEMIHAFLWGTSLWWLTLGLIGATLQTVAESRRPRWWSMPRSWQT